MGLENANKVGELNDAWPLNGDLAKLSAAHIRLIKSVLKKGYLGEYTDLATIRALTPNNGCSFFYNNTLYLIVDSSYYSGNPVEVVSKFIRLTSGKLAIAVDTRSYFGRGIGTRGNLPISGTANRLPLFAIADATSASFEPSLANSKFPDSTPVQGDVCVQYFTGWAEARQYNGVSWVVMSVQGNGEIAVLGQVATNLLLSQLVIADTARLGATEFVGSTYMEVTNPNGFGPDSLRYWFGEKAGRVNGNGKVIYSALTKANAIEWKSFTETNTNGSGTPVSGGAVLAALGMGVSYSNASQGYNSSSVSGTITISIGVNGTFSIDASGSLSGAPASGNYVTTPSSATGSLYEVKFEQVVGDAVTGTLNTFLPITQVREVSLSAFASPNAFASKAASVRITIQPLGSSAGAQVHVVALATSAQSFSGYIP